MDNPIILVCLDDDAINLLPDIISKVDTRVITISLHNDIKKLSRSPADFRLFTTSKSKSKIEIPKEVKEVITPYVASFFIIKEMSPDLMKLFNTLSKQFQELGSLTIGLYHKNKISPNKWLKSFHVLLHFPKRISKKNEKKNQVYESMLVSDVLNNFSLLLNEVQELKNIDIADIESFIGRGDRLFLLNGIGTGKDSINSSIKKLVNHPLGRGFTHPKSTLVYLRGNPDFSPHDIKEVQSKIFEIIPECNDITFSISTIPTKDEFYLLILMIE